MKAITLFFLIIILLVPLYGQQVKWLKEPVPLKEVHLFGNKKTDKEVIIRELLFEKGQWVTDSLLQASQKRLENLWLFNRVEFFPVVKQDSLTLYISVTERFYIYPYPILQVEDRSWEKLTYGFGFAHVNFRGKNEKLNLIALWGHRSGYLFNYSIPWFAGKHHLFGGLYLNKYEKENRAYPFVEKHHYAALTVGKFYHRYYFIRATLFWDHIQVPDSWKHTMLSKRNTEDNRGIRVAIGFDNRDLIAYPSRGNYIYLAVHKNGIGQHQVDYWQFTADLRKYIPLHSLILAGRLYTTQTSGQLPVYDRVYLGFMERIRGHFYEIHEGKHVFSANAALRFPLLPVRYFSLKPALLPADATRNLKFGINMGIFAESGIVWNQKREFSINRFINGFGLSLHFLLPYIEVFHVDAAFNEQLQPQFIAEALMPF